MNEQNLSHLETMFMSLQEKLARTAHHHHKRQGQRRLLKFLQEKKAASQRELVEWAGVSPQSLGETLGKLERHGFITRTQDERDKRMVNVALTEAGEAVDLEGESKCHHKQHDDLTALYFKDFSEDEKETLAAFFERMNKNFDEAMQHLHTKHHKHHNEKGHCGCHGHQGHHGCANEKNHME